jgi:hypothetical protein
LKRFSVYNGFSVKKPADFHVRFCRAKRPFQKTRFPNIDTSPLLYYLYRQSISETSFFEVIAESACSTGTAFSGAGKTNVFQASEMKVQTGGNHGRTYNAQKRDKENSAKNPERKTGRKKSEEENQGKH